MNWERFSKPRFSFNGTPYKPTSRDIIRRIHDTKSSRQDIIERRALAEDDERLSTLDRRLKRNEGKLEYLQDYLLYILKGEIDRIPITDTDDAGLSNGS